MFKNFRLFLYGVFLSIINLLILVALENVTAFTYMGLACGLILCYIAIIEDLKRF